MIKKKKKKFVYNSYFASFLIQIIIVTVADLQELLRI